MAESADVIASLPEKHREAFKEPLGPLHTDEEALFSQLEGQIITVGDVVSYHAECTGRTPDVAIIDGRTKREAVDPTIEARLAASDAESLSAVNPPGTLTVSLIERLRIALERDTPIQLSVDGEEDLAVLPAIMLAPVGSHIIYGQPDKGMVLITVDEQARDAARALLAKLDGDLAHVWALLAR